MPFPTVTPDMSAERIHMLFQAYLTNDFELMQSIRADQEREKDRQPGDFADDGIGADPELTGGIAG